MDNSTYDDQSLDINTITSTLQKELKKKTNDFEIDMSQEEKQETDEFVMDKIVNDANQYFLVKILSPEITENEKKKRAHKDTLINIVKIFLISQFILLAVLIIGTIVMIFVFHGLKNDLELSYIDIIIKFICAYITSVVVEVIAMLKFIVENVFDTSITGLVEFYKDKTKEKEEENKNK